MIFYHHHDHHNYQGQLTSRNPLNRSLYSSLLLSAFSKSTRRHPFSPGDHIKVLTGRLTLVSPCVRSHGIMSFYELLLTSPAVSRTSHSSYLDGFWDGRYVVIQLLFLYTATSWRCSKHHTVFFCLASIQIFFQTLQWSPSGATIY